MKNAKDMRDGDDIPQTPMVVDGSRLRLRIVRIPFGGYFAELTYECGRVNRVAAECLMEEFYLQEVKASTLRRMCAWLAREYPAP